jgi:hypothetical protein
MFRFFSGSTLLFVKLAADEDRKQVGNNNRYIKLADDGFKYR